MGELQDTSYKIIESYNKGYQKGQQDLTINNVHKKYNGLCIEFKTPNGNGKLSDDQTELLEIYEEQNYKCIVSNDYDHVIREIGCMKDTRI